MQVTQSCISKGPARTRKRHSLSCGNAACAATDLHDPEHGAGVSVGRWFRNVNWVAVPGYDLFYQGNLKFGEPLTQAHFDATVRDVISKGVYRASSFMLPLASGLNASLEDFIAQEGIGTDLALQFARSVFCARVPITEPMLRRNNRLPKRQESGSISRERPTTIGMFGPTTALIRCATLWRPPTYGRRYRCRR